MESLSFDQYSNEFFSYEKIARAWPARSAGLFGSQSWPASASHAREILSIVYSPE